MLVLTGVLIFVKPGSITQLFWGLVVSFLFFAALAKTTPYKSATTDRIAIVSEANLFITMLCLLMMKINLAGEKMGIAFYDQLLVLSNLVSAVAPSIFAVIVTARGVATAWIDSSKKPLKEGDVVRIVDHHISDFVGRTGVVKSSQGWTEDGCGDRASERIVMDVLLPTSTCDQVDDSSCTSDLANKTPERLRRTRKMRMALVFAAAKQNIKSGVETATTVHANGTPDGAHPVSRVYKVQSASTSIQTHNVAMETWRRLKNATATASAFRQRHDKCHQTPNVCGRKLLQVTTEVGRDDVQRLWGRAVCINSI